MNLGESIDRLRRFLRDPDGDIWTDADLKTYLYDATIEIGMKTSIIERVESYRYPPEYTWSYMHEWEYQYTEGDRYRCLLPWLQRDWVVCFPWEVGHWMDTLEYSDEGERFTHPWESAYCSPADVIPIPLHAKFDQARFAAFDEYKIEPLSKREISELDSSHKTRTGFVTNYYRPDSESNQIVLYPAPSTYTWQEETVTYQPQGETNYTEDNDWAYTGGPWELSEISGEVGTDPVYLAYALNDEYYNPHYPLTLYSWEDTDGIRLTYASDIYPAFSDSGGIISSGEAYLDRQDSGLTTDVIETDGALLMIYSAIPNEQINYQDESDLPHFAVKYAECGALERAFGADTDGYIPSLRDYWRTRKEIGIQGLKRMMRMRMADRTFQFGPAFPKAKSKGGRLPAGYPAV